MAADPTVGDLNKQIAALRVEEIDLEDWHGPMSDWQDRDDWIRNRIHELERQRDLLPQPSP